MRPHLRIRKTIKWGGAAVALASGCTSGRGVDEATTIPIALYVPRLVRTFGTPDVIAQASGDQKRYFATGDWEHAMEWPWPPESNVMYYYEDEKIEASAGENGDIVRRPLSDWEVNLVRTIREKWQRAKPQRGTAVLSE